MKKQEQPVDEKQKPTIKSYMYHITINYKSGTETSVIRVRDYPIEKSPETCYTEFKQSVDASVTPESSVASVHINNMSAIY